MRGIRVIRTDYFTFSSRYISLIMLTGSEEKRFLRPTIYTIRLITQYYNELFELKEHTFESIVYSKKEYLEKYHEFEKIKEYIDNY